VALRVQSKVRSGRSWSHQDAARKSLASDSGATGVVTFNGSVFLRLASGPGVAAKAISAPVCTLNTAVAAFQAARIHQLDGAVVRYLANRALGDGPRAWGVHRVCASVWRSGQCLSDRNKEDPR